MASPATTTVVIVTAADLSSDFVVATGQLVTIAEASQTVAGKVQFATPEQLAAGAENVAVDPHDIQAALSGQVPAIAGANGIVVVLVDGVNTIESTLGNGTRTTLV
jgi:hypothetical protein